MTYTKHVKKRKGSGGQNLLGAIRVAGLVTGSNGEQSESPKQAPKCPTTTGYQSM
ncbi:hypothetical protein BIW11_02609 [Tropilaelaps mercedesae]|uniref:Uncharacterized protein n=1 Tax=Tropilaelaps mercedesae TaxID=418985 RepID=A0A1V9Y098_9ACAR|nr:hypothetical protein BIW11_02609 [Tropilaelaps mercedesae]